MERKTKTKRTYLKTGRNPRKKFKLSNKGKVSKENRTKNVKWKWKQKENKKNSPKV